MIGLMFPGQGSQCVGMAAEVYTIPEVKRIADEADAILGYSLSKLMLEGPLEKLSSTRYTQAAIFTASMMILRACELEQDVWENVAAVAGHSVGEYAALCASGCLPFDSALAFVKTRGEAMEEASPKAPDGTAQGGMCAILGLDYDTLQEVVDQTINDPARCAIANDNCPGQIVITGEKEAVELVRQKALEAGAKKGVMLAVSGPFHSLFMKPAAQILQDALEPITFCDPKCAVIPNVSAKATRSGAELKMLLPRQVFSRVRWRESTQQFADLGIEKLFEIGPGKTLTNITRRCLPDMPITPINTPEDVQQMFLDN